ncbi:hypothetical protein CAPTEDRAFT_152419 [Capitella teleta]|uniref:Protein kinase domain-containing protein n=1 Tax=Capitella teleta TaxID=283909 RepID=R7V1I9_CAPTE|nr:hypothetical protein CAPTEDRAFT_152419 [Capitella teleta]|eukprot:ELU10047.1 hypothetical protein CAPTEDRAFT_152419 [Capitella teleta]
MTTKEDGTTELKIEGVQPHHSGEYACLLSNTWGYATSRSLLTVIEPVADQPPWPPMKVNQQGMDVVMSWDSPPGFDQLFYDLDAMGTNCADSWKTIACDLKQSNFVVEGLLPGSQVQFRIVAKDEKGETVSSQVSDVHHLSSDFVGSDSEIPRQWKTNFSSMFEEKEDLGRGRYSVVNRVIQKHDGKEMAAKFVNPKLIGQDAVATEISILQKFEHAGIVRFIDAYESPTNFIIILSYISGPPIFDFLCTKPTFNECEASSYMYQLLNALQYIHSYNVAHLDIKPENILFDTTTSNVVLVDFGDARLIENDFNVLPLVGSPEFSAPEIVNSSPVGLATDIWAIGVLSYVLLSGISPFLDESPDETCAHIMHNDFSFPDDFFGAISPEARDFISHIVVSDMRQRPSAQNCVEHPWMLKRMLDSQQMKSISTSRLARFLERRKGQKDVGVVHMKE